jgi:hypothetical protein
MVAWRARPGHPGSSDRVSATAYKLVTAAGEHIRPWAVPGYVDLVGVTYEVGESYDAIGIAQSADNPAFAGGDVFAGVPISDPLNVLRGIRAIETDLPDPTDVGLIAGHLARNPDHRLLEITYDLADLLMPYALPGEHATGLSLAHIAVIADVTP